MASAVSGQDFARLKTLLQRDQRTELDELRTLVEALETSLLAKGELRSSMGEELVAAIEAMPDGRRDRLTACLSSLIAGSVDTQIRDHEPALMDRMNKEASGLVRRGIVQAIAEFAESIQQQINDQLSFRQRLKNRVAAARSGTDEAQVALHQALSGTAYRALLIHRPSGMLMASAERDGQDGGAAQDPSLQGSLISAIIGFADEAMGMGAHGEALSNLKFGDRSLVLSVQNLTILALEFSGHVPAGTPAWLDQQMLELIDANDDAFTDFKGDLAAEDQTLVQDALDKIVNLPAHAMTMEGGVEVEDQGEAASGPLAMVQAALPLAFLFLIAVGGTFFATKAWYARAQAHQAETLVNELAQGRSDDVVFSYNPSTSQLIARDGLILGEDVYAQVEAALIEEFHYATVHLDQLTAMALPEQP